MKKIIGITGNSGSGKTTATEILRRLTNADIIDADKVVKELSVPGTEYLNAIKEKFSESVLFEDGSLNRKELANKIYNNKEDLEILNSLTFKYVVQEIRKRIEESNNTIIILDAPLLFESGLDKECTSVIGLIAPFEVKVNRIVARDGISEEIAYSRINIQAKDEYYIDKADLIIENMQTRLGSLSLLHEKTYNTQDFKNINLNDFIADHDNQLKTLAGMNNNIEFESDVDEYINLTIEVITPLLLIIDELSMNSIKHAFPDKNMPNKKIFKSITKIDEDHAELIFRDNGVGIENPRGITKNLGCEIIKNLTKQLNGEIKLIEHRNGTGYSLVFPIKMKHTIHG